MKITHRRAPDAVRRARKDAYPPLEDLADALYWQAQGNPAPMAAYLAKCGAVKTANPKPAVNAPPQKKEK